MRKERVVLEHHVDRPPIGRHAVHVLAADQHLAFARLLEAGDHPERRGLAAARRPEEGKELAGADLKIEPLGRHDVAEPLSDAAELDQRSAFGRDHDSPG